MGAAFEDGLAVRSTHNFASSYLSYSYRNKERFTCFICCDSKNTDTTSVLIDRRLVT